MFVASILIVQKYLGESIFLLKIQENAKMYFCHTKIDLTNLSIHVILLTSSVFMVKILFIYFIVF